MSKLQIRFFQDDNVMDLVIEKLAD